tara:strand:- start:89 stop:571 length:483 start_codon:yes stop_codon:yes gene_type:complete
MNDEADTLLIVYQRGFADGKKAALAQEQALKKLADFGQEIEQQAEPVAWMDREGDLYKMPEIKNWAPPHTMLYTTPPQREWDKPSASFNEWWNGDYDDSANPFEKDSAAYWAWAGWQAAKRQWVGLTDDEILEAAQIDGADTWLFETAYAIEAKLKERNT